jgi:hypothetical protein
VYKKKVVIKKRKMQRLWLLFYLCVAGSAAANVPPQLTTDDVRNNNNNNNASSMDAVQRDTVAFDSAMNTLFAAQSGTGSVSAHVASRRALSNLMRRQSIAQGLVELRSLSDIELIRMAQLAAVGGTSRWYVFVLFIQ